MTLLTPPETPGGPRAGRRFLAAAACLWLTLIAGGYAAVVRHSLTAGAAGTAPVVWPAMATCQPLPDRATLVLAVHPRCSCTRATATELARVLARAGGRLGVLALCFRPSAGDADWDRTPTVEQFQGMTGVTVVADPDGVEAARFGALTSGEAAVYAPDGRLLFRGGLTAARGHEGPSPAQDALLAAVVGGTPAGQEYPAFGCPLRD